MTKLLTPTSSPFVTTVVMAAVLTIASGWAAKAHANTTTQIRPTMAKPAVVKPIRQEATGVSMSELADLLDQKISEVAKKRATAPVVRVKAPASRVSQSSKAAKAPAEHPIDAALRLGKDVPWAYYGATGPESWGRLKPEYRQCMLGKRQSPIDIQDQDVMAVHLDPIEFDYKPTRFTVTDTGRTVEAEFDLGNSIKIMGQRYELQKMQFHRPSEERINGKAYPMSAHLVHKSPSGQYAMVAILLDQGEPHATVQQVLNNLPLEKQTSYQATTDMDLSQIVPAHPHLYYNYMGSLTTPPCTENVVWMVMKEPMTVSVEQINLFHRLYPMNARPVQKVSGRIIKEGQ